MDKMVKEIQENFEQLGIYIPAEQIEERLDKLLTKFKVPADEARRTIINYFSKEHGIRKEQLFKERTAEPSQIGDITSSGQWLNLRVKVLQLWDNSNESISQVGIIGDETGRVKFIKWARDALPDLEEGKSYRFNNLVVSEWNGRFEVGLNRTSSIEPLSEDIEIGPSSFTAAMVGIQEGSGLIKRCPECNRALTKGACMEHGKVDGNYDLRIKAILDDGTRVQDVLIGRELSEQMIGLSLDEAISLAADELDQSVVLTRMRMELVGKYYHVDGSPTERYLLADSVNIVSELDMSVVDELIGELEVE